MLNYDLKTIAAAVNGVLHGDENTTVEGVQIDSRLCTERELFVPFKGANFDGHDFAAKLYEDGRIAACFWDSREKEIPQGVNVIVVDDCLKALQRLASYYRRHVKTKYVGITGSSGKTSTKDIIAACLSVRYKVHKTFANKNNEIGIPLTILQADDDCDFNVVEMGISDFNEMEPMVDIVLPDMTVVTCIAEAHIMNFHDMDNTSREKSKINCRLGNGQAYYAFNGYHLKQHLDELNLVNRPVSFGFEDEADVRAENYRLGAEGSLFTCNLYPGFEFSLSILGRHQVANSLSAIAICHSLGYSAEDIQKGFDLIELTPHRLQLRSISGAVIIDDTYNANPASMCASLQTAADYDSGYRKIAVLGDMLELGENERELHASIADRIDFRAFDGVYLYGDIMNALAERLQQKGIKCVHCDDFRQLKQALRPELKQGTLMVFKASNGMKFASLIDELEEM
ncbi:MAG: UDP-N-acetylmuramoyl-tripeptide--D-alanyl-D-alanine ligase [Erysipelotrichaceae bacterium]|nr:UDP-N-acetylmuramoyl-tripeptide--D-alanyl-D-alanine ligase [Erysipelotrichaceae bacterium]